MHKKQPAITKDKGYAGAYCKDINATMDKASREHPLDIEKIRHRESKLDPYRENIRSLIDEHNLSAVRILEEIRKCANLTGADQRDVAVPGYFSGFLLPCHVWRDI